MRHAEQTNSEELERTRPAMRCGDANGNWLVMVSCSERRKVSRGAAGAAEKNIYGTGFMG